MPEVQTRKKEKCGPRSTISVSSAKHLPEVQTRKKEKCDPLSTISVSSAKQLPEVQTPKKRGAVHSPQFLFARPSACPRFRPEKKKKCDPLSTISFSSAKHLPEVQTRKKEKCGPLFAISVSSAQHLPEVQTRKKEEVRSTLHNFYQLGQAPARGSEKKSAVHSLQFLSTRPSTCPRFRPRKKKRSTLHSFC